MENINLSVTFWDLIPRGKPFHLASISKLASLFLPSFVPFSVQQSHPTQETQGFTRCVQQGIQERWPQQSYKQRTKWSLKVFLYWAKLWINRCSWSNPDSSNKAPSRLRSGRPFLHVTPVWVPPRQTMTHLLSIQTSVDKYWRFSVRTWPTRAIPAPI